MSTATVYVRSPHLKDYAGQALEQGQVFQLANQLNDIKLMSYGYVVELEESDKSNISKCISCGREFADESFRNNHSRKAQHEAVDLDKPNLKRPKAELTTPNPDSDANWDLETEGSPAPPPVEQTGLNGGRIERTGKGTKETFRLQ